MILRCLPVLRVAGHRWKPALVLLLGALACGRGFARSESSEARPQQILFQVVTPAGAELSHAVMEVEQLRQHQKVRLTDDGTDPTDMPEDGVYVGRVEGPYARRITYTLRASVNGAEARILDTGLVSALDTDVALVALLLEKRESGWNARRTTAAWPAPLARGRGSVLAAASWAWAFLLLGLVVGLTWLHLKRERT